MTKNLKKSQIKNLTSKEIRIYDEGGGVVLFPPGKLRKNEQIPEYEEGQYYIVMTTYGRGERAMITENALSTTPQSRRQGSDLLYARYMGKGKDSTPFFRLHVLNSKMGTDPIVILKGSE